MRGKAELLLKKMKSNRDITWNEKGELKYKDKIVHGSNIVDLVNDNSRGFIVRWWIAEVPLRTQCVPRESLGSLLSVRSFSSF
jgi:hypothetical protein